MVGRKVIGRQLTDAQRAFSSVVTPGTRMFLSMAQQMKIRAIIDHTYCAALTVVMVSEGLALVVRVGRSGRIEGL